MTSFNYELLVIGAGGGGLSAAKRAASYGAKVAILESDRVGGTCVMRGCAPKKLMVYASQFSHLFREAESYGWSGANSIFNWIKLRDKIQQEILHQSQGHINSLKQNKVELISGFGRFIDPNTVEIWDGNGNKSDRQITAKTILIAVGGEPVKPDAIGIEYAITSQDMFHLPEFPQRLAIIGGGYIGVEFAGIMNGLGAEVTLTILDDYILSGFERDVRINVQEGMIERGIEVKTHVDSDSFKIIKAENGLTISFSDQDQQKHEFTVDKVLAATGRKPNLSNLGLENAGVEVVDGAIAVKADSSTSQEHIYAVGDCTDRINLTPVAIAQGRAFADTLFGHKPKSVSYRHIPSAVFSQPEAASVGLTEAKARELYGDGVKIYTSIFTPMFYSLIDTKEKTFMKLIAIGKEEWIVGIHMVGKDAAEIIQGMAIIVTMGGCKQDLDRTMSIHPTTAEEFFTMQ
jgi:glutathione reductase (NADPH)